MQMTKDEQLEVISSALDSYAGWFPDDDKDDREARKSIDEARDQIDQGIIPECDNAMNDHIDEIQGRENLDLGSRAENNVDMGEALYVTCNGGASDYVLIGRALYVLDDLVNGGHSLKVTPSTVDLDFKDLKKFARENYGGNRDVMNDVHKLLHPSSIKDRKQTFYSLCDDVGVDPL